MSMPHSVCHIAARLARYQNRKKSKKVTDLPFFAMFLENASFYQ